MLLAEGRPIAVEDTLARVYEQSGGFGMDEQIRQQHGLQPQTDMTVFELLAQEGADVPTNTNTETAATPHPALSLLQGYMDRPVAEPTGIDTRQRYLDEEPEEEMDILDLARQVLAVERTLHYEDEAEHYLIPPSQYRRFVIASMFPERTEQFWDAIGITIGKLEEPKTASQHRELFRSHRHVPIAPREAR